MKDATRQAKALGFSKLEQALFGVLSDAPQSIARLSRTLKVTHTSLYRPLKALKNRGLVETVVVGKRKLWKNVSRDDLISSLGSVLFAGLTTKSKAPLHPEFFLHTGKEPLMKLYENLATTPNIRVWAIQPNRAAQSVLETFPFDRLIRLNERIKEQHVIVEALLQEDFIPFYINLVSSRGLSIEKIFSAFGGRTADTAYVPKQFINFDSEITILPKTAYIFHWSKDVAVEIRNEETIGLLRDLFALAKAMGRKVDQNEMVRKYLSEQNSGQKKI